jgi:hypothetical protein
MRRFGVIAVTVVAALTQATTGSAATALTHTGSHFYSRTTPAPCFARAMAPKFPRRLAMGCTCPRGSAVQKAPSATYRFAIPAGRHFTFQVAWGGNLKPRVTTNQAGRWSYIKVRGPRRCAVLSQVVSVTATPS